MKTVAEIRDVAKERSDDMAATSKKAAYAVMGAPVVAGRRIADYAGKVGKSLQKEFEAWVVEGERLSGEVSEGKMVSEIKERVDFENLQGRVEKLKDQLEDVLINWKDTFKPGEGKTEAEETKPAAKKPATKKAAAKKPAARKPATRKPATRKPATKKPAKKAAAKKPATKKATAAPKAAVESEDS